MERRMLTPEEIAHTTIEVGCGKAEKSTSTLLILGILAGIYISFGAAGATVMLGTIGDPGLSRLAAGIIFPVGLMLVVMAGAELFTGNNLMTLGCLHRKYGVYGILRNWTLVYIGNLIGSLIIAYIISLTGIYSGSIADMGVSLVNSKIGLTMIQAVSRGILCNIIVVLAVWLATGAQDITGKIFACLFPILLFIVSGYEHSIANMYFFAIGKFIGHPISWSEIWFNNLIPVTFGNIIGGGIIIPILYYLVYVRKK